MNGPLHILIALLLACVATQAQDYRLNSRNSGVETKTAMYDTHWICLGDTLSCDTTDDGTVGYLIDGMWALCIEVPQDLWNFYMERNPSPIRCDTLPVTGVTPAEVDTFAARIGRATRLDWRLPTREEWLFIYHGGLFSEGYAYCGSNRPEWVAWYHGTSGGMLHPCAQRIPNEVGMFDMLGNAAELVIDGDRTVAIGGTCLDSYPATNPGHLTTDAPPKLTGFRIVCRKALWFSKEE